MKSLFLTLLIFCFTNPSFAKLKPGLSPEELSKAKNVDPNQGIGIGLGVASSLNELYSGNEDFIANPYTDPDRDEKTAFVLPGTEKGTGRSKPQNPKSDEKTER